MNTFEKPMKNIIQTQTKYIENLIQTQAKYFEYILKKDLEIQNNNFQQKLLKIVELLLPKVNQDI